MTAESLSASRMASYLRCALKFRFQYVDNLPAPWKSAALALGTTVHATLESFHRGLMEGTPIPAAELVALFRSDWAAAQVDDIRFKEGEDGASLGKLGEELIVAYAQASEGLEVVATELPFEVPLLPATAEQPEVILRGVFDAVLADDVVLELKTACRGYDSAALDTNLQFRAYEWAYRKLFGRSPRLRVTAMLKKKRPEVASYDATRGAELDDWFVGVAAEVVRGIRFKVFPPSPSSMNCSGCEYKAHCKAWPRSGGTGQ